LRLPVESAVRHSNADAVPLAAPYVYLVPLAAAAVTYAALAWMTGPHAPRLPLDTPNVRSLHATPVPRSGGIAIMAGGFAAGLALGASWPLLGGLLALALLSYVDDHRPLPAKLRLSAHALVAVAWLALEMGPVSPWLLPLLFLGIVWMTNLYNFMDGIDGLAGGMAVIGFGAYALGFLDSGALELALLSASIAAAAAAFLRFNFHPARIFMGDVGSIPLGFLAAALGVAGWRDGVWPLWFPLLVFSPFAVDATFTLVLRLARRERLSQAHRDHYYQRLVRMGLGHRNTSLAEYALMIACAAAALAAREAPTAVQLSLVAASGAVYLALAAWLELRWARFRRTQGGTA
jgi:UDP-N-acetylmuramyl pentapeptide phosphotransferase/UDP-N-acetylglucosamine-1-phosphate transferase